MKLTLQKISNLLYFDSFKDNVEPFSTILKEFTIFWFEIRIIKLIEIFKWHELINVRDLNLSVTNSDKY